MLSDIISAIIMPPGIFIVILFILSLYALKKPKRVILAFFLFLTAFFIYITSIPITTFYLNKLLVDVYKPQLPRNNSSTAVIVLGGGSSRDETNKPFQPNIVTMERLYAGVKLTKEHPSYSYLILSAGDTFQRSGITGAEIMAYAAETMGCKAKIILESKARNTDENLKYCSEIVKKLGVKNVIIVTNNFHIRRSMDFAYLYMPTEVNIFPYPSGGQQPRKISLSPEVFLPDTRVLRIMQLRIKEIIGLLLT